MRSSKFGWHYPPGAANDPNAPYNQPDRSHEHEWVPDEDCPIFEDGAVIFRDYCGYAEGRHGEGWECEETRRRRFDARYIWISGEKYRFPERENWTDIDGDLEWAWIKIEDALFNDDAELTSVDPESEAEAKYEDIKIRYAAEYDREQ